MQITFTLWVPGDKFVWESQNSPPAGARLRASQPKRLMAGWEPNVP